MALWTTFQLRCMLSIPGITVEWDKGMRVYVKLDPVFQGKVCGLCGNYDNKADNDFRSRSDLVEASSIGFANTWKTSQSCPNLLEDPQDPCEVHTERKYWATSSCGIMKTDLFSSCHSVVSLSFFNSYFISEHTQGLFPGLPMLHHLKVILISYQSWIRDPLAAMYWALSSHFVNQ